MTKKEEEQKKLTWRLSELPTAGEVADLVDAGVLDRDEARQILIREEMPQSREDEISALKEMVATLQSMVKDLLARPTTTFVPYTKTIEVQPRYRPYWDTIWMNSSALGNSSNLQLTSMTTTKNGNATYSVNQIV